MNRSTDDDAAFEAELAALAPADPSSALRARVAEALALAPTRRPTTGRRLAERLLWACGGAAVGAFAASAAAAPAVQPPIDVTEESVAWADAGVQFIDDRTPARVLRRVAVERHRPAGGAEYHVPREDVILVPVALQ